jgi:hypothetical protein
VNHTFAALELSKQDVQADYAAFESYFRRFLKEVYRIENVDPRWDRLCYDDSMRLIDTFFATLAEQTRKALEMIPRGSPTNIELEKLVNEYCEWLEANADRHDVGGGDLLYLAVYAFAGSPQAASSANDPTTAQTLASSPIKKPPRESWLFDVWSAWRDSNSRPLAPHASALPGCATRRSL